MSLVSLNCVSVDLPVYESNAASLKKTIAMAATGGRIGGAAGVTTIQALRNISLTLRDGDRLGVMGHNGCGKTTLLRTVAGVYAPSRGTLRREGSLSTLIDPTLGIELDATGRENILIRGLVGGVKRSRLRRIASDIIDFSGLGPYIDMPVRTYSTGMLMRLAFSIVTSVRSDILIMDEWLAVGDESFQREAETRMRDIVDNSGILVLASHSLSLVSRECTQILTLTNGSAGSLCGNR